MSKEKSVKILQMHTRSLRKKIALALAAVAAVSLLLVAQYFSFAMTPMKPQAPESVIVEVTRGQNPQEIAKLLAARSVISDPKLFLRIGRLTNQWSKLKAGEYQLSPGMTPMEILAVLTSGVSIHHPVTVREGENMYEVADELQEKGLAQRARVLELCRDPKFIATLGLGAPPPSTLEGYLYPETYFFNKALAPEEMLRQMVRKFSAIWGPEHESRARELRLTRHQVVTLASIIEKETGAPQERPMISSVFHNRLKKRMRLQSDPTTIYGIWEKYKGNIHRSDLASVNPYNTYTIPALPIGPISNPGKEALQAALFPSKSEFLFFVSHNDGTHEFTRTFEQHSQAVKRFQLDPKARAGKSWRDLSKQNASTSKR
jgi:UPF0755 protein